MKIIGQSNLAGLKLVCSCHCDAHIAVLPVDEEKDCGAFAIYYNRMYAQLPLRLRLKKAWDLLRGREIIVEDVTVSRSELHEFAKALLEM